MLIKLYKIINSQIYKRHKTPNDIVCQVYRCSEGTTYDDGNEICHKCSLANEPLERLDRDGWETKFCYTYYDDDSKENSDNRR